MELTQKEEMAFSALKFQMEFVATVITASDSIKVCERHKVKYIDEPNKVHRLLSQLNANKNLDTNVKLRDIANFALFKVSSHGNEIGKCSKCMAELSGI